MPAQRQLRLVEPPEPAPADAEAEGEPLPDIDTLFRRYARYVGSVALRILGRESDVDDVVQDVFLDAHRGLSSLRDPGAVRAWLARLTVRKARRVLRRRRLMRALGLDTQPDYGLVVDPAATPEQRVLLVEIYRLMDAMPSEERLAWSLRYLEGETLERVAELCGCSLATAKRRIRAARVAMEGELRR